MYRLKAGGLKAMDRPLSVLSMSYCRRYWCWDRRKAETAWGVPVMDGLVRVGLSPWTAWPPGPATQGCP